MNILGKNPYLNRIKLEMKIKKWLYYRFLRLIVKYYNKIKIVDSSSSGELDEVQKSIYHIAIKLIHSPDTQLIGISGKYQLISSDFLILISYSNKSTISLIEKGGDHNIHTVNIDSEYIESILNSYDREISKRMKRNESNAKKLSSESLNRILEKI